MKFNPATDTDEFEDQRERLERIMAAGLKGKLAHKLEDRTQPLRHTHERVVVGFG
ncbi:MAG TPA: hypothetical protein PLA83_07280 [Deltaproteobacteria bacterium]|nr:hypothetical protein [Deltaproteobacteria bacterium]HQI01348.1 hypothetical protein [Deltaproteobacteria bacterium]